MLANNACGAHSVAFGTTADNVVGLDGVLADGTRMRVDRGDQHDVGRAMRRAAATPGREGEVHRGLQQIVEEHRLTIERRSSTQQRRISGYALDKLLPDRGYDVVRLLCGSEGTLATTLEATVDLVALPAARVLLVLGFEDPVAAADAVPVLLPHDPLTMSPSTPHLWTGCRH